MDLADGCTLERFGLISNTWLMRDEERRAVLIDTGFASERARLLFDLWRAGVRFKGDLAAVILTHRHTDHAGNAGFFRRRFDCPVYCHEQDVPFLTGSRPAAPLATEGKQALHSLLCRVENHLPARSPVDEAMLSGETYLGFTVIPAFGHTEGSVMLYHRASRVLFSGDAIIVGYPPLRTFTTLRPADPNYTPDSRRCYELTRQFLDRPPALSGIASGHGALVTDRLSERCARLAAVIGHALRRISPAAAAGSSR